MPPVPLSLVSLVVRAAARWGDALRAVAVAALLVPALLLVTVASLPALALLPFWPAGGARAERIVRQLICWTRALSPMGGHDRSRS
ncbi:hypothetical protein [Streptomyces sp. SAJ15]|uniref:hypothetical protein n=1 Tax=Streptomyces sp. SAJ15 TaxID=2011095 RepID=UPI0011865B6F|nr:hypothetical protein [Streptomyces sp. SAJ15]TVL91878.1 hypothetical protein CD790_14415 [Streptomyces sp. SAJ15]